MYKALIADDEPYVLEGLKLMIDWQSCGFEIVAEATNGAEALNRITEDITLVVTDINMPQLNGLELIRELRKKNPNCDIIVLTGYNEFDYAKESMKYGVKYFLNKPIDIDEFEHVLREIHKAQVKVNVLEAEIEAQKISEMHYNKDRMSYSKQCMLVIVDELPLEKPLSLPEGVYAYEQNISNLSFIIGYNNDYKSRIKSVFQMFIKMYPTSIGCGCRIEDDKTEEALQQCMDTFDRLVEVNSGMLYWAYGTFQSKKFSAMQTTEYGDRLMARIEMADIKGAMTELENFFNEISQCDGAVNYAFVYRTYMIININKLIVKKGGEPERVLGNDAREWKYGIAADLKELENLVIRAVAFMRNVRIDEDGKAFEIVERYIREHYKENIVIKDMAKKLYTSPGYLGTVFSKKLGVSIKDYLHTVRMEEAIRLMEQTDAGITDIAYAVGYANYNNFFNHFKRIFGCSSADYMKRLHNEEFTEDLKR